MQFRLVCGACVLALTGCFADPPSGTGGGEDSTSAQGSSSDADASSTSTGQDATSTQGVDGSSSGGSSSGGFCEASGFSPDAVPADVVALVDSGVPTALVRTALEQFQGVAGNNVAILAPQSEVAALTLESDCPDGCGAATCATVPNRVIVPYTGSAYEALADFMSFSCIFREPAPNTSGPVANLWFITASPNQMPPMNLAALVLEGEEALRVHVACPGCDENLFNANALLKEVVEASGGTVTDSDSPAMVAAQVTYIGGARHSCLWEATSEPDFYIFTPAGETELFFADPFDSQAECPTQPVEPGGMGGFHPDGPGVRLCPETCKTVQAFPAERLDIEACE